MNLLLLEDEIIISTHIKQVLENNIDLKVIQCSNYAEFLENISNMDIAILDINLNDSKTGINAAEHINKYYSKIPFIYLTGNTNFSTINQVKETSPSGYISKPVNEAALIAIIETVIKNSNLQNELNEQKMLLSTLINSIPESIFLIGTDGIIIKSNDEAKRRLNISQLDKQENIFEIVPENISLNRKKMVEIAVRSGKPVSFEDYRAPYHFKNYINPILDKHSKVKYFSVIAIDNTREKKAALQRDKIHSELQQILEFAPVGLCIVNRFYKIVQYNSTFRNLFNLEENQENLKCHELFKLHNCIKKNCPISNKENLYNEFHIRLKVNSDNKHFLINETVLDTLNNEKSILISVTDLSAFTEIIKKANENIELERKSLGQKLHDGIGQKLTGLSYIVQNLKTQTNKNHPEDLETIELISQNIRESINMIRNLSKGIWPINIKEHGFTNSLYELVENFNKIYENKIHLDFKIPVEFQSLLKANNMYFIIQEAILNSIKHGDGSKINFSAMKFDDHAHFVISNNIAEIPKTTEPGIGEMIIQYRAELADAETYKTIKDGKYIFNIYCSLDE